MFVNNVWLIFSNWIRPILKWFLRKTTGLCELQRICYGEPAGSARCLAVERSLELSRNTIICQLVKQLDKYTLEQNSYNNFLDYSVILIMREKDIEPHIHPQFPISLRKCMLQIWSYRSLIGKVEDLRRITYDADNLDHETKLLELWSALMPNEKLQGRITKQWQDIGFQGEDPKTDFRGMGMLGLENLLYFAQEMPQVSSHVLSHSRHPKYGYTFAIVGINLTSMAYNFLKDESAKTYMFNAKNAIPDLQLFHKFYCYLFYEFDKLWIDSKPQNIMEFSVIYKKFESKLRIDLADPAAVFRIKLAVDKV